MDKDSGFKITHEIAEHFVIMGDNYLDIKEIDVLKASFEDDNSDSNLARILAIVNNQSGKLGYIADDPANSPEVTEKYLKESDIWWDFLIELTTEVKLRLEKSNLLSNTNYQLEDIGTYYLVKPFMEQNGYHDGSGWWIENG